MSKFVPDNFKPKSSDVEWAIQKFDIDETEVNRQFEQMADHEFRRSYTDWNRVFRNWIRKSSELETLYRERKPWKPEVVTDDMRKEDQRSFDAQIERFKNCSKSGAR